MSELQRHGSSWKRNIGMVVVILLGVALIIIAPLIKSPPKQIPVKEYPVKVRSMVVPSLDVVPHSIGFGRVAPGRTWESVAEVSGQIVWVSDELRDGKVVPSGTELLRIEDSNYRLALAQTEAQLQASEVKYQAAQDGLTIAKKNLSLLQTEYKRQNKLADKGTIYQLGHELILVNTADAAETLTFDPTFTAAGNHDAAASDTIMTDSGDSWTIGQLVGRTINNTPDGSSRVSTANTATTVTAILTGGTSNDWQNGEAYTITPAGLNQAVGQDQRATFVYDGEGWDIVNLYDKTP